MEIKKRKMSRFGHRLMLALILVVVLASLVLGAMVYGGYRVTVSKTNLPNLVLDGIPVGENRAGTG